MKAALLFALFLLIAQPARAHQADTSYTRIALDGHHLLVEATFDLHVLGRIVVVERGDCMFVEKLMNCKQVLIISISTLREKAIYILVPLTDLTFAPTPMSVRFIVLN